MGIFRGVELDDLVLTGQRLTLRPWRPDDAAAVHGAISGHARRFAFLDLPDPYTADDARDYVTGLGNAERAAGTGLGCALVETATERVVGSAELWLPTPTRPWPDIGYWVAPDATGRRYAAEATRVLTDWAFAHGVNRIEIRTDVRNLASARTALAAGYRYDGLRRAALGSPDGRHDLATFGRLATDTGEPIAPALPRLPADGLADGIVALRVIEPGDMRALIEQETDPVTVATGFTGVAPAEAEIVRMAERAGLDWMVGGGGAFAIVDCESSRFAGSVKLRFAGPPQIGGIGYAVHPAFRGRGYTGRALRLLVRWAFEHANFARLELGAKTSNVASQKAALAGGFEPDGIRTARMRCPDGSFEDEVRFALVNPRHR